MINGPRRKQGLVSRPKARSKHNLIHEEGCGAFVCAQIVKQGGSNDITQVALYIDGENVVALTFAAANNLGFDQSNNSGVVLTRGLLNTMTIQFNEPIYYEKELRIELSIGQDRDVVQIVASAVLAQGCIYPKN